MAKTKHNLRLPRPSGKQFKSVVILMVLAIMHTQAFAATLRMSWDAQTDPEPTGYKVYVGTASGTYDYNIDAGASTTIEIGDLNAGQTYYLAVSAYNEAGESALSEEVTIDVPAGTQTTMTTSTGTDTGEGGGGGGGGGGGCFIATAAG